MSVVRVLSSISLFRSFSSIPLGEDELPGNKKLAEELSHLGEIGSLLNPSEDEIDELKAAVASCSDDLFAATAKTKLESALGA